MGAEGNSIALRFVLEALVPPGPGLTDVTAASCLGARDRSNTCEDLPLEARFDIMSALRVIGGWGVGGWEWESVPKLGIGELTFTLSSRFWKSHLIWRRHSLETPLVLENESRRALSWTSSADSKLQELCRQ